MNGALLILAPTDETLAEVAELAAAADVVLVERRGVTAFCGRKQIPDGWHRVGVGVKVAA